MPTSGLDFDTMTEEQRRAINSLPAMLYHGVSTGAGVLMRMNSVPRSIAETMGSLFEQEAGRTAALTPPAEAREFLRSLGAPEWERVAPQAAVLSGEDYRRVWERLAGEG
jgi:hypothetical protein